VGIKVHGSHTNFWSRNEERPLVSNIEMCEQLPVHTRMFRTSVFSLTMYLYSDYLMSHLLLWSSVAECRSFFTFNILTFFEQMQKYLSPAPCCHHGIEQEHHGWWDSKLATKSIWAARRCHQKRWCPLITHVVHAGKLVPKLNKTIVFDWCNCYSNPMI